MANDQRIYKTGVFIEDDGLMTAIDTIHHEGSYWLVPSWLGAPDGTRLQPVRIIRMRQADLQEASGDDPVVPRNSDFFLNGAIPIAVLNGETRKGDNIEYEVREYPDLTFGSQAPAHGPQGRRLH